MKKEDQIIAIAEACNKEWTRFNNRGIQSDSGRFIWVKKCEGGGAYSWEPFDPTRDLNDMRNVETSLWREPELVERYEETLQRVYLEKVGYEGAGYWFMANAATRAEAFLRTLYFWREGE